MGARTRFCTIAVTPGELMNRVTDSNRGVNAGEALPLEADHRAAAEMSARGGGAKESTAADLAVQTCCRAVRGAIFAFRLTCRPILTGCSREPKLPLVCAQTMP
jgi:hypothetical protein